MALDSTIVYEVMLRGMDYIGNSAVQRVRQQAYDDIVHEIRIGNIPEGADFSKAPIVKRLLALRKAVDEGRARRNFKVMAQIFVHSVLSSPDREDDFDSICAAVGGMRRLETVVLAVSYNHLKYIELPDHDFLAEGVDLSDQHSSIIQANKAIRSELIGKAKPLKTNAEFNAIAKALSRTGFLIEYAIFDGDAFQITPLTHQLAEMIRLEEWASDARHDLGD